MLTKNRDWLTKPRIALTGFAAALALASVAAMFVAGGAPADAAKSEAKTSAKATVLGGSVPMQEPLCPLNCQIIPSVNGFQRALPSGNAPYRVPANGKLTAWKLYLGKPTAEDRQALNDRFGSPPQAAITVLKRIKQNKTTKFRLRKKSPVEGLNRELGSVATFRLEQPLRVKKGQFVALSVPTWAPAFAAGLNTRNYTWRASRQPGKCGVRAVDMANPQLKVGSKRQYACTYKGSRLLYTAKIKFNK